MNESDTPIADAGGDLVAPAPASPDVIADVTFRLNATFRLNVVINTLAIQAFMRNPEWLTELMEAAA